MLSCYYSVCSLCQCLQLHSEYIHGLPRCLTTEALSLISTQIQLYTHVSLASFYYRFGPLSFVYAPLSTLSYNCIMHTSAHAQVDQKHRTSSYSCTAVSVSTPDSIGTLLLALQLCLCITAYVFGNLVQNEGNPYTTHQNVRETDRFLGDPQGSRLDRSWPLIPLVTRIFRPYQLRTLFIPHYSTVSMTITPHTITLSIQNSIFITYSPGNTCHYSLEYSL